MAKITSTTKITEYSLSLSEEEVLALIAALRYRGCSVPKSAQYAEVAKLVVDVLIGALDNG